MVFNLNYQLNCGILVTLYGNYEVHYMLRSATKIKLNSKTIQNYDGLLIAPEIDFLGLMLKADPQQPLDPRITEFFTSRGAKIVRTKIFGDFFIKITGEFNITKLEIDIFLRDNPDINSASLANIIAGKHSDKMKQNLKQLSLNAKAYATENRTLHFTDGIKIQSVRPPLMFSENGDNTLKAGDNITMSGMLQTSGRDSNWQSDKDIHISGLPVSFKAHNRINAIIDGNLQLLSHSTGLSDGSSIDTGWLGFVFAGNYIDINAKRSMTIQDYVLNAENIIALDSGSNGNICINIDKS
jgi:hypothetical protein